MKTVTGDQLRAAGVLEPRRPLAAERISGPLEDLLLARSRATIVAHEHQRAAIELARLLAGRADPC